VNDVALGLLVALFGDGAVEVVVFGAGGRLMLEVLVELLLDVVGFDAGGLLEVLDGAATTGAAVVCGVGTALGVVVGSELSAVVGSSLRDVSDLFLSADIVHLRAINIR
jgi:hypothetical protein